MIIRIFISNFKAYEEKSFDLLKNNILIGENDSGKSTILQALDAFFNAEKIDTKFVRDVTKNVEIGVLFSDEFDNKKFIKKVFKPKSFKYEFVKGDINDLNGLSYIYISPSTVDVKKLISDLAIAKTIESIPSPLISQLESLMTTGINQVINSIDQEMIVVGGETTLIGNPALKIDSALKFDVSSGGIPIEGRGSGYQKNIMYSLLTGSSYQNVIIGIDEIENSLSVNNAKELLNVIKSKFCQSLVTTHSVSIVQVANQYEILPIYNKNGIKTITELYESLGDKEKDIYVLVEGKTDVPWIKKGLELIGTTNRHIIIPCGGCNNIESVKDELTNKGYVCRVIKDGDSGSEEALERDCIELYTPLEILNAIFEKQEGEVPKDKISFFDTFRSDTIGDDTIKKILSDKVEKFLTVDNPLVLEIKKLLGL